MGDPFSPGGLPTKNRSTDDWSTLKMLDVITGLAVAIGVVTVILLLFVAARLTLTPTFGYRYSVERDTRSVLQISAIELFLSS